MVYQSFTTFHEPSTGKKKTGGLFAALTVLRLGYITVLYLTGYNCYPEPVAGRVICRYQCGQIIGRTG
jgi:hypothetical protein